MTSFEKLQDPVWRFENLPPDYLALLRRIEMEARESVEAIAPYAHWLTNLSIERKSIQAEGA